MTGSTTDTRRLRIAVLCSDGPHHAYLVRRLAEWFDLRLVVVEPWSAQVRIMRQRRRWRAYAWALYHTWRRRICRLDAYRRRYFDRPQADQPLFQPTKVVDSVNASDVPEWLAAVRPDITIVMGTSILRAPVLAAAGPNVLNIHGGALPWYRGNHCVFFAMLHRAWDRAGATVHFIDPGVDTGDIVELCVPGAHPTETAEAVYCRAERMAIDRLIELLSAYAAGQPLPRTSQAHGLGMTFRTADRKPYHDVVFFVRRMIALLRLKTSPPSAASQRAAANDEQRNAVL